MALLICRVCPGLLCHLSIPYHSFLSHVRNLQVVDEFGGKGNVLNFNVGEGVKFALPNVFWTRLSSKYGTVSTVHGPRIVSMNTANVLIKFHHHH